MSDAEPFNAIAEVVRLYVEGMCQGDGAKLRLAMHPRACCIGHLEGGLEWDDTETFIATVVAAVEHPDPDPWFRIKAISVTGDIAVVRVEDYWLGVLYDDILTLLLHCGKWMIVSKAFYQHPT